MKYKQSITYSVLSLVLMCCMSIGHAEEMTNINVSSESWEDATNKDGTGLYWDIIRLIYEPVGISVKWDTTSYARSVALVKQKRSDAWVGSYLGEEQGIIYPKAHFDADVVSAMFIKKPDAKWQGEQSLEGKNVGWIRGYELHEYLDVKFNKRELSSRDDVLELLKDNRLDYFIDAMAELETHFGEALKSDNSLVIETIKHLNLYLGFANTLKGNHLAEVFDERFPKIIESGELKTLFEKWGYNYIF
jgi:polar amino acid transport system substrate-binding protein